MRIRYMYTFKVFLLVVAKLKELFAHLEKLNLNFSSSSFVIRVNLLYS